MRRMVEELRAEEPGEIAWDDLEQKLMSAVERDEAPRVVVPSIGRNRMLGRALAAVAAAALVALGARTLLMKPSGDATTTLHVIDAANVALAPGEAGALGARDLFALHAGDVIESNDASVSFGRDGFVRWAIAPASRLVVRSLGDGGLGHTVALERGSIRAEVTPRPPAARVIESFVIEVEGTRVAVRGTAFSVTRADDRVVVDVEHGTVAVGPTQRDEQESAHLLVGPSRATFSLAGRDMRTLPAPTTVKVEPKGAEEPALIDDRGERAALDAPTSETAPPAPAKGPPAAAHAHAPASAKDNPAPSVQPSEERAPATLTEASVRAHLARCFADTYRNGSPSVHVSISSTLRIVVKADGTVRSARFDPPLKPEFQTCAGGAIAGRFAEGERELTIPVSFER